MDLKLYGVSAEAWSLDEQWIHGGGEKEGGEGGGELASFFY